MTEATPASGRAPRYAGTAAAMTSVVLWASAFVGIRVAGRSFAPGPLSLGRLAVALVALLAVGVVRRERVPARAELGAVAPVLLVCGVVWFGVYNLTLNAGERRVDAGTAAMIVYIAPILIAVFAGIFLREGFPRALFAGCVVGFGGVCVIALATASRAATTAGVLLCLLAAVSLATGAVTQKVVLRRLTGLQTITLCCLIGVVVLAPFAGSLVHEIDGASTGAVLWTIYLGVFPTAIGFLTWAYALARSPAGPLAATILLVPVASVIMSWLALGEAPAALAIAGGALCLLGVALARDLVPRRPRRRTESPALSRS